MEIQGYHLPDDLYYEPNHYWVKPEGGLLVMGMTDFAQKMAGEIVFVKLPAEGKKLEAGKKFATLESGKWVGKVFAPVSGRIAESNQALEDNPALINEDCYGRGWMYKITPDEMGDLAGLIHGPEAVKTWMAEEIKKHKKD